MAVLVAYILRCNPPLLQYLFSKTDGLGRQSRHLTHDYTLHVLDRPEAEAKISAFDESTLHRQPLLAVSAESDCRIVRIEELDRGSVSLEGRPNGILNFSGWDSHFQLDSVFCLSAPNEIVVRKEF